MNGSFLQYLTSDFTISFSAQMPRKRQAFNLTGKSGSFRQFAFLIHHGIIQFIKQTSSDSKKGIEI